jgi:ribulose-phosphate 3-epimerase
VGNFKIAASILAADFTRLGEQVREAEAGGADLFHCDVMDGQFVPNISFGPMVVDAVNRVTKRTLDVHLMIEHPEKYLEMSAKAGADMINVHVETCPNLRDTIKQIRALNVKAGVAINPETPFESIQDIIPEVDRVLVMTVHPGFGGQKFIDAVLPKMDQIADVVKQTGRDIEIGVDGGIDEATIGKAIIHGANVLIAGSSVFQAVDGIAAAIARLRTAGQDK